MTKRKNENTNSYIERWRKEYKKLTPIYSNLINGTINFTSDGFNHLLYEDGHRRPLRVIENRLPYITLIPEVILNQPILLAPRIETKDVYGRKRKVVFYTFMNRVGKNKNMTLKVVVRKVGDKGNYNFQSVMKKKFHK